jgi:hypothetical protein
LGHAPAFDCLDLALMRVRFQRVSSRRSIIVVAVTENVMFALA